MNIKQKVSNNFWTRMLGEMLCAFLLIFTINTGQGIGESLFAATGKASHEWYNVFYYIYNINIVTALWIGSWTFLAFLWMRKTSLSSNFFNLVISYKHNDINRKEFWSSLPFQFIGGIFAAFFTIIICLNIHPTTGAMGGTITSMKGIFLNSPHSFDISAVDPIKYGYAATQGLINAFAIMFLYTVNTIIDRRHGNGVALSLRYTILIISIAITTIFYANTTNWVRLLSPAIVSAVNNWDTQFLTTTLTFIAVQTIGLLMVYFLITVNREA